MDGFQESIFILDVNLAIFQTSVNNVFEQLREFIEELERAFRGIKLQRKEKLPLANRSKELDLKRP